jgi:hypothetical protein
MIGGQLFADAISTGDFRRRRWNCDRTRITRASRLFLRDEVQGKQADIASSVLPLPVRGLSRTGFVADSAAQAELAFLRVFGWSA